MARIVRLPAAAGLACIWWVGSALAEPRSTADLTGIWAHSEADCQTKLSGALDGEDLPRPEKTRYELVGFCKHGMDLLYQPVVCDAKEVKADRAGFHWSGTCSVKGDAPYQLRFTAKSIGPNAVSFDENDFKHGDYWIRGNYGRCSLTYKCANE